MSKLIILPSYLSLITLKVLGSDWWLEKTVEVIYKLKKWKLCFWLGSKHYDIDLGL